MNIYLVVDKTLFLKDYIEQISSFGNIIYCSENNCDTYDILSKDNKDKIIIYDPDYAGWSFPDEILNNINNIKAIFLGTTDKSYLNINICEEKNISVVNIPKYASESVAEYLFMYMFTLAKKIPLQIKNENRQDFSDNYLQQELKNKKVGIVGLGNIGKRLADMCFGVGMDVCYWNRSEKDSPYKYTELQNLFKQCDVVYICLSINEETRKIITDTLLNSMKKTSILISSTGSQLFNLELVNKKVKNNELYGLAFEEPNAPLNKYEGNIMTTSEYGWFTKEASNLRIEKWFDLIVEYLRKL